MFMTLEIFPNFPWSDCFICNSRLSDCVKLHNMFMFVYCADAVLFLMCICAHKSIAISSACLCSCMLNVFFVCSAMFEFNKSCLNQHCEKKFPGLRWDWHEAFQFDIRHLFFSCRRKLGRCLNLRVHFLQKKLGCALCVWRCCFNACFVDNFFSHSAHSKVLVSFC